MNKTGEQFRIIEYPLIIMFILTGGLFLISCYDLISIFIAIELQSYGLYILCSVYRDSEKAISAGLTYFLLGGLSSCFILLGSSFIYVNSGNTCFDGIYSINNIENIGFDSVQKSEFNTYLDSNYGIDSLKNINLNTNQLYDIKLEDIKLNHILQYKISNIENLNVNNIGQLINSNNILLLNKHSIKQLSSIDIQQLNNDNMEQLNIGISLLADKYDRYGNILLNDINKDCVDNTNTSISSIYNTNYINLSLIVMSIGLLFKISAAPFHFWSPDVYDSIPTIVTTFVAIFTKISIFILLLELVHHTTNTFNTINTLKLENQLLDIGWIFTLLISSFLSLIIGSVLGLTQFRIKRLYAYSTISHIGFLLLALSINSIESIQSFIFYLVQYSISNLNAFILLITIGFSLYIYIEKEQNTGDSQYDKQEKILKSNLSDKKNSPLQLISQLKGYYHINPILALSLALTIFSFVGIPPLIGFFAKQMVLSSALDKGYIFMALIAILTSVISACYYLALIKQMFFSETHYVLNYNIDNITIKSNIVNRLNSQKINSIKLNVTNITLSGYLTITISVLTLVILLFILNPNEWLRVANILALILFNT